MAEQGDEALVRFLKLGRTPDDPASVMKRLMPARGGNMALGDRELGQIVSYLRTLQAEATPAEDADDAESVTDAGA